MFSWLLEGLTGARPQTARTNVSTRALPRDISLSRTNMLLQRPVPELKSLRLTGSGQTLKLTATLRAAAGGRALHVLPEFRSNQFEVSASLTLPVGTGRPAAVGVRFAASDDTATPKEFALVGLNLTAPPAGLAVIEIGAALPAAAQHCGWPRRRLAAAAGCGRPPASRTSRGQRAARLRAASAIAAYRTSPAGATTPLPP